jgi:hypothetical protein
MSPIDQRSMQKSEQWRMELRVSHHNKMASRWYQGHHAGNPLTTIVLPRIPEWV